MAEDQPRGRRGRRGWICATCPAQPVQVATTEEEPLPNRRDQRDLEIAAQGRRIRELERLLAQARLEDDRDDEESGGSDFDSNESINEEDENLWGVNRPDRDRRFRPGRINSSQNLGMKIDILDFEGKSHPDEFIDWLHTVERVFDIKNLSDEQKVKLVAIKLKKNASIWWEHVIKQRTREGKAKIVNWRKMKKKLMAKNLPVERWKITTEKKVTLPILASQIKRWLLLLKRDGLCSTVDDEHEKMTSDQEEITYADTGKICNVIIDGGSSENVVSDTMGNEVKVSKRCLVKFSIGKKYKDEVRCDVVPMDARHILLGRPWQFDLKMKHDGFKNTYTFQKDLVTVILGPFDLQKETKNQILSRVEFMAEIPESFDVFALVVVESNQEDFHVPSQVISILEEFADVVPQELPSGLPPIRDI
ncbi:hypothetical protein Tco_0450644 [Tanacetum coccineum]